jgi:hypothetical protein
MIIMCNDCPFFKLGTYETSWDYSTCKEQPFMDSQDGLAEPIIMKDNIAMTPNWCPINNGLIFIK